MKAPPKTSPGYLEVGETNDGFVVVNHPALDVDEYGCGHILFSPAQARRLAALLIKKADSIESGDNADAS